MPLESPPNIINRMQLLKNEREGDKQAGAELGQAQLQLELGFTLIKIYAPWNKFYHTKSRATKSTENWSKVQS